MIRYRSIVAIISLVAAGCWSTGSKAQPTPASPAPLVTDMRSVFYDNLPAGFEMPTDDAGKLLLHEYGAVFVARGGATPPKKIVFSDQADVLAFQASLKHQTRQIGAFTVDLQTAALSALLEAIDEARRSGLSIEPRGGDSSRRDYDHTVGLWASRVDPGLVHWVAAGRVTQAEATRIRSLTPYQQVPEIFKLEKQGIFFAKTLDKSIIYSVAPPGASQHISMLALDVKEFDDARVREILSHHGWFQTVTSDLPHFTYLGVSADELPKIGLKKVVNGGREFWVPDI